MVTVSKSELKARMLAYFREVERTGQEILVTDHGRPSVKIVPAQQKKFNNLLEAFADVQGKMTYSEPLEKSTSEEWGDLAF